MKKNLYIISGILSVFLFTGFPQAQAQLLSEGPNNPGAVSEEFLGCLSCPGSEWTSHPYAMLPDSQYATTIFSAYPNCFMTTCYFARALVAYNFGFTIPLGAVIQGVKADVLRKASSPNAIHDTLVQLVRGGIPSGGNRAAPAIPFPAGAAYITYGDSTDLWDTAWTVAEINSTDFGVYFKPLNKTAGQVQAAVDHIQVTVYYLSPTGIPSSQTSTSGLYFDAATQQLFLPHAVQANGATAHLAIFDAQGRLMMEQSFTGQLPAGIKVDLPVNGIYIASFSDGNSLQKTKFIVRSE